MDIIVPTAHHVLVKPTEVEEKTKGGIYLATSAREDEQLKVVTGELFRLGPQAWVGLGDGEPQAKVGDSVYFAKYGGFLVEDGKLGNCRILNDEDIIAVIKQEE